LLTPSRIPPISVFSRPDALVVIYCRILDETLVAIKVVRIRTHVPKVHPVMILVGSSIPTAEVDTVRAVFFILQLLATSEPVNLRLFLLLLVIVVIIIGVVQLDVPPTYKRYISSRSALS
jgi:hypothetical protein